ncbi:hypothetical protein IQ07DRAFT_581525 [Pyrenochaeta sp. DS3sAY3a]|nr:hypothetical protein IQ07DRAFT_581525 [Pyrenochaeta sp. DS3sAY3a]
MCDYTAIQFKCVHKRYIVRAWCTKYQETHKRCPANVVTWEYRLDEYCCIVYRSSIYSLYRLYFDVADCKPSKGGIRSLQR